MVLGAPELFEKGLALAPITGGFGSVRIRQTNKTTDLFEVWKGVVGRLKGVE